MYAQGTMLPMNQGCVWSNAAIHSMMHSYKWSFLLRRIWLNIAWSWGALGPIECLDDKWTTQDHRQALIFMGNILGTYTFCTIRDRISTSTEHNVHYGNINKRQWIVDNYSAMVPVELVVRLNNLFDLNLECFSDVVNNNLWRYCVAPDCPFPTLSEGVDAFEVIKQRCDAGIPTRALANPPFIQAVVNQLAETIRIRAQHHELLVIYVGPASQCWDQGFQEGWAFPLASLRNLPFIHPAFGRMGGLDRNLELWVSGNINKVPLATVAYGLSTLRIKHRDHAKPYRLELSPWLRKHGIGYIPRGGIGLHTQCIQDEHFQGHSKKLETMLYAPGKMDSGDFFAAHQRVLHTAFEDGHPAVLEACARTGALPAKDRNNNPAVYIIVCLRCPRIYIGSSIRGCWTRYKQEIGAGRRLARVTKGTYGKFRNKCVNKRTGIPGRQNLYVHMVACGLHMSIVMPIKVLPIDFPVTWLRRLEWTHIRMAPQNRLLNIKVPSASLLNICMRTMNIRRQGILQRWNDDELPEVRAVLQAKGTVGFINHVVQGGRVQWDPRTLLCIFGDLTRCFERYSPYLRQYQSVMLKRLRGIHIPLPTSLTLRVMQLTPDLASIIRKEVIDYVGRFEVHPVILSYYKFIINIVRVIPQTMGQRLFNIQRHLKGLTWMKLMNYVGKERRKEPCMCNREDNRFKHHSGHVLFRFIDLPKDETMHFNGGKLSSDMLRILADCMKAVPCVNFTEVWTHLQRQLVAMNRKLYHGGTSGLLSDLLRNVRARVKGWWNKQQAMYPQVLSVIKQANRLLGDYVMGPCDKDPAAAWVCCPQFYFTLLHDKFFGHEDLGGFRLQSNIIDMLPEMIRDVDKWDMRGYANKKGLTEMKRGDISWIPRFYTIFKARSFGEKAEVALRPITSHIKHVTRRGCRLLARGMTTVLRFMQAHFRGISRECVNMADSSEWWREVAKDLKVPVGQSPNVTAEMESMWLFELDMANMYYNISKEVAMDAVTNFLRMTQDTFRRRNVAVSKTSRECDRMGTGSSQLYYNFTLKALESFVGFELFGNHRARVGYIGYEQTKGVPMGGECSAQICAVVFFMVDIRQGLHSQTLGFSFFRFRDNLPGILDRTRTSMKEVKQKLTERYGMPLKTEGEGGELVTLEQRILLTEAGLNFMLKPHLYSIGQGGYRQLRHRVPPAWSTNRKAYLGSVLPNTVLKCTHYASNRIMVAYGLVNSVLGLVHSGYKIKDILSRVYRCTLWHSSTCHLREVSSSLFLLWTHAGRPPELL